MYKEGFDEGTPKMLLRNAAKLKYDGLVHLVNHKLSEYDGQRRWQLDYHQRNDKTNEARMKVHMANKMKEVEATKKLRDAAKEEYLRAVEAWDHARSKME